MFFKKTAPEPRPATEQTGLGAIVGSIASSHKTNGFGDAAGLGLVLDALGGVLTALARFPIELPDRTADESANLMGRWQRHATLGYSVAESSDGTSVGVVDRDWRGLVRAVVELRRDEHTYVEASSTELRDALWSCVETVHNAVKIDQSTDKTANAQFERARNALKRMQTGAIKQEVLGAMQGIESALTERREEQQKQFVTLASRLDKVGQQLEEARKENTTDPLTGIGNRKLFDAMLPRAVQMFSLARQPVVLLMIDLDKLKLVNDMYGHQAGDAAIATLGKALSKVFLRQTDVLCRYGGDEFAVILHNTDWKMAQTLARRLQDQISEMPAPHPAMEFQIGASVGVAQLEPFEDTAEWVARADKALYRAKQNGRDRVCIAESLGIKVA